MSARPTLRKCYGTNPRTGKGVGERHRWSDYASRSTSSRESWGKGRCDFCGRYREDLLEKPKPPEPVAGSAAHLDRALKTGK